MCIASIMMISSVTFVSADAVSETTKSSITTTTISSNDDTRAYQLVWKYKKEGGHYYKRRWNATLGIWYDPEWILVQ